MSFQGTDLTWRLHRLVFAKMVGLRYLRSSELKNHVNNFFYFKIQKTITWINSVSLALVDSKLAGSDKPWFNNRFDLWRNCFCEVCLSWKVNWRNDPHTCWTISATVSHVHLKNCQVSSTGFEPWTSVMPLQCSYQVNLLGSCVPVIWSEQTTRPST